jgi:hypothetical protein
VDVEKVDIWKYFWAAQQFQRNLGSLAPDPGYEGATPGVDRYKKNGKYIDIYGTKNLGRIVSYGTLNHQD